MKKSLILILLFSYSITTKAQNNSIKKGNIFKTSGRVIKNTISTIPSDFAFMGKEVSNDWKKTGFYLAGITGLILTDKITTRFLQDHIEPNLTYALPNISIIGKPSDNNRWLTGDNAYITYPIIGNYLFSFVFNKERGQYASINALKAISHSTIITQIGLKTTFGRDRPYHSLASESGLKDRTGNHLDFFNKRSGYLIGTAKASAFPSLHTTAYFAIAKVFQMEYDNYWIPYTFMSVIYLSDFQKHNHWVSDLVVGGIIGTIIGRSIVLSSWKKRNINGYIKKDKKFSVNIVPQYSKEFTGIHLVGTF